MARAPSRPDRVVDALGRIARQRPWIDLPVLLALSNAGWVETGRGDEGRLEVCLTRLGDRVLQHPQARTRLVLR